MALCLINCHTLQSALNIVCDFNEKPQNQEPYANYVAVLNHYKNNPVYIIEGTADEFQLTTLYLVLEFDRYSKLTNWYISRVETINTQKYPLYVKNNNIYESVQSISTMTDYKISLGDDEVWSHLRFFEDGRYNSIYRINQKLIQELNQE